MEDIILLLLEEELQRKTVAQLKVIVMNYEEITDTKFKIPTRKNDIIQLILDYEMFKVEQDYDKRKKQVSKRSLFEEENNSGSNSSSNNNDSNMENDSLPTTTTTTTTTTTNNNSDEPVLDNADAWFNKEQTALSKRKKLIKSFDDFEQKSNSIKVIDDIFKYYFKEKTNLEVFITTNFPTHGTTRCSNYLFRRWHFICLTCSGVDIRYCVDCFLNGNHRAENHRYSLVYTPTISCICDCGDGDVMKVSSFCSKHRYATNISQREQYIHQFPEYLRDAFKTFFGKLIQRAITLGGNSRSYVLNESEISNIVTYLGKAALRSPIFAQLIAEELTLTQLDLRTFDITNPVRIAPTNAITPLPQKNKRQKVTLNATPLYILFHSHLDFSTKCFYLFAVLSYHHQPFGQIFFQQYLANFNHLMRPQPRIAIAESCYHLQQYYKSPNSILIPFASGKVNMNLFQVLLQHYKNNMDTIHHSFTMNQSNYESYRFESKLFSRLLNVEDCANYFSNNFTLIKNSLELCQYLHQFSSGAFKFENIIRELKDLIHLESCLINGFNHMLTKIPNERVHDVSTYLIDSALELSTNIKYPHYNKDRGSRLLFPLPRIIALSVLHDLDTNIKYLLDKIKANLNHFDPAIADIVFNITTFRAYYYAHCCRSRNQNLDLPHVVASPTDDDRHHRHFTQKFMMFDFLTLQMSLIAVGPTNFLYYFLCDPFGFPVANSEWLKVIFEILVNVIQTRATLNPTEEDIEYHYIQAVAPGYFYYTELLNFKFVYKNIPMETKKNILEKICVDTKVPKMQLKPEYWSKYDPYYWNYEYIFKVHFQELCRDELAKHQRETKVPECFPSAPVQLKPIHPSLVDVYQIFLNSTLMNFLHFTTMKIQYANFKGFKDIESIQFVQTHNMYSKISGSDVTVINDIYYIILMGLNHFNSWFSEQPENVSTEIRNEIKEYLTNANYKKHPQHRSQFTWKSNENIVSNLLAAYTPSFKNVRKKLSQSFLDTLIYCWKINGVDQNPLLQSILVWLAEFDESINEYIESQGITEFDPKKREQEEREARKKMMQAKRDEILRQMKEKQKLFLSSSSNQELYDETETMDSSNTSTSTTSTTTGDENNNANNNHTHQEDDQKICMICRDGTSTEPLYTVARVTNCTLGMNQKSSSLCKIIRERPQCHLNTTVQGLLGHQDTSMFFDQKRLPAKVLKLYPFMIEFFNTYYQLPSYITSCLHYTHRSCISQSIHNFDYGFQCPQCNANSNILIPIDVTNLTMEEVMKFFLNFQDGDIDEVFERHLWGMVYSNLDIFEMKTRLISNYAVDEKGPYHLLTDLEFKQELATLRIVFGTISSCVVPPYPEDLIDVDDHMKFHLDPFLLSTYLIYLRKSDYKLLNNEAIKQNVFNFILKEAMGLPNFKVTQAADSIRKIYEELLTPNVNFDNYVFPILRKAYLYHCLAMYEKEPNLINQLTQHNLSNFEFVKSAMGIKETISLLPKNELENYIERYTNLKKGFVSYIPSSYLHIPKFKKLHSKYIDFILKNIPNTIQEEQEYMCFICEKTQTYKCLSCGWSTCASECSQSFVSHPKKCPNGLHQVFLFIDITTGTLKVVDLDKDVILYNNDSLFVYFNENNEPSTITNNELTLSPKHLQTVYKKWIQMQSTNTIQSMDIDIPNALLF